MKRERLAGRAYIEDLRACGICPRASGWFSANGLDWRSFVQNGIAVEELQATGDARADKVAEAARGRQK